MSQGMEEQLSTLMQGTLNEAQRNDSEALLEQVRTYA
jgi:hypothetical protein